MNALRLLTRFVPLAAAALAASVAAASELRIGLSANTPVVVLTPRTGGRFINLPDIDFEFELQPECPAATEPISVMLSIADTRATLRGADMRAGPIEPVVLQVPASQIAPVAAESFCRVADSDTGDPLFVASELTVPEALTVHASLRCAAANTESIAYFSRSLDVTLRCEKPAAEESVAGE